MVERVDAAARPSLLTAMSGRQRQYRLYAAPVVDWHARFHFVAILSIIKALLVSAPIDGARPDALDAIGDYSGQRHINPARSTALLYLSSGWASKRLTIAVSSQGSAIVLVGVLSAA